jgi:hypothetical protein
MNIYRRRDVQAWMTIFLIQIKGKKKHFNKEKTKKLGHGDARIEATPLKVSLIRCWESWLLIANANAKAFALLSSSVSS